MTAYWLTGDTRRVMAQLPAGSVDLVLTSPPFLALRSYLPEDDPAKVDEIGSEANPAVASGHSRDSISIDLDRRNADLARARIGMWFQELEPTDLGGAA